MLQPRMQASTILSRPGLCSRACLCPHAFCTLPAPARASCRAGARQLACQAALDSATTLAVTQQGIAFGGYFLVCCSGRSAGHLPTHQRYNLSLKHPQGSCARSGCCFSGSQLPAVTAASEHQGPAQRFPGGAELCRGAGGVPHWLATGLGYPLSTRQEAAQDGSWVQALLRSCCIRLEVAVKSRVAAGQGRAASQCWRGEQFSSLSFALPRSACRPAGIEAGSKAEATQRKQLSQSGSALWTSELVFLCS